MKEETKPDQKYLKKIENVKYEPIFILGLPRSGTSILYKILYETGCFNAVTAYHIIRYDEILSNHIKGLENKAKDGLNHEFMEVGLTDRGIDRLSITADFPEEYGFVLGDRVQNFYIKPKNVHKFKEMAKKVQYISKENKPLLLKNPFDFQSVGYIKEQIPNSKFVFISREPIEILDSTHRAIRYLMVNKQPYSLFINKHYQNLYSNPFRLWLIRFLYRRFPTLPLYSVTRIWSKLTTRFIEQIKTVPKEDYMCVKYEELCEDPQGVIEGILEFLDTEPDEYIDFTTYISPRETPREPAVKKMQKYIEKKMAHYSKFFGYK